MALRSEVLALRVLLRGWVIPCRFSSSIRGWCSRKGGAASPEREVVYLPQHALRGEANETVVGMHNSAACDTSFNHLAVL